MAAGAVVTTVGKGLIAAAMLAGHVAKYIQHGTGTTTPVVGNTALQTASADAVATGTESNPSSTVYRVVGTVTSGGTQAITEVGLFATNAPASMLYHEVFSAVNVGTGDTVTYTINITVG
jgi:hypothetical protein